MKGFVFSNPI